MLQIVTLIFFPAIMVFSAISDLFTMTISNRISIALVLVFLPFAFLAGLSLPEIGIHLACGIGVLVATFGMFAMGWIGGGDAKLAAAIALWIGWDHLLDFGTDAALVGGALTLAILAFRRYPPAPFMVTIEWVMRLHQARLWRPLRDRPRGRRPLRVPADDAVERRHHGMKPIGAIRPPFVSPRGRFH